MVSRRYASGGNLRAWLERNPVPPADSTARPQAVVPARGRVDRARFHLGRNRGWRQLGQEQEQQLIIDDYRHGTELLVG